MARNLALTLAGPHANKNVATHLDKVTLAFSNPPKEVDDVKIVIRDLTHADRGRTHHAFTNIVRISGRIRQGKFEYSGHSASNHVYRAHPKLHEMQVVFVAPDSSMEITTRLPDFAPRDHLVRVHRLKWFCKGKVGGKTLANTGKASMHAVYRASMLVPQSNAPVVHQGAFKDPSFPLLRRWADQWVAHDRSFRSRFLVPTKLITGGIKFSDYEPLLKEMEKAAAAAKHGIVCLATGHGDGGSMNPGGTGDAWLDLAAEDSVDLDDEGQIVGVFHSLLVDEKELRDMAGRRRGNVTMRPTGNTLIKMRALDAMRGIFARHDIRVLILHTCTAGNHIEFTQLLSDRLQVYLRAHKLHVTYEGFGHGGDVHAFYEDEGPNADSLHEWPIHALAQEREPGDLPPSSTVPSPP